MALLLVAACAAQAQQSRTPHPVIEPATKGTQCVADADFMRRNHMEVLKHQRDGTVRAGDRAGKFSLKACISCHASQQTQSVAKSETNFCVSCHAYAAVKIDCFECHATKPQAGGTAFHPVVPTGPGAAGAMRLATQVRQLAREGAAK
jgi:predicted CXXCH cytochrome family protein